MERRLAKKWPRVLNRKRKKVSLWSLERISIRFLTQVCSSLLLPLVLPYNFLKMSLLPSLFYLCTPASLVWGAFGETCSYAHTMECTPTYQDGAASEQEGCAAAASRTLRGTAVHVWWVMKGVCSTITWEAQTASAWISSSVFVLHHGICWVTGRAPGLFTGLSPQMWNAWDCNVFAVVSTGSRNFLDPVSSWRTTFIYAHSTWLSLILRHICRIVVFILSWIHI